MQSLHQKLKQKTQQGNLPENERLLMQYQGVFKHHIAEFAEKVVRKAKPIKNLSR